MSNKILSLDSALQKEGNVPSSSLFSYKRLLKLKKRGLQTEKKKKEKKKKKKKLYGRFEVQ